MKVAISGAQGQMSQVLAGGLWICVRLQVDGEIATNHRLGQIPEAPASYEKALAVARQEPDRHFPRHGLRN